MTRARTGRRAMPSSMLALIRCRTRATGDVSVSGLGRRIRRFGLISIALAAAVNLSCAKTGGPPSDDELVSELGWERHQAECANESSCQRIVQETCPNHWVRNSLSPEDSGFIASWVCVDRSVVAHPPRLVTQPENQAEFLQLACVPDAMRACLTLMMITCERLGSSLLEHTDASDPFRATRQASWEISSRDASAEMFSFVCWSNDVPDLKMLLGDSLLVADKVEALRNAHQKSTPGCASVSVVGVKVVQFNAQPAVGDPIAHEQVDLDACGVPTRLDVLSKRTKSGTALRVFDPGKGGQ